MPPILPLGYAVGILLELVYLREVLDHLRCLRLPFFLRDIAYVLSFLMWNHFLLLDLCVFEVRSLDRL